MNKVLAQVRISNLFVPFLNISKYPNEYSSTKRYNDEMESQLIGTRDCIPQTFVWYRDFIAFDMLRNYQTYCVNIVVSETLEIDPIIDEAMNSGRDFNANVIVLPFQVIEGDKLYLFGDNDEDLTLSFTLPAGNYQLLFQNRHFTREEIEASLNNDWEDGDYDDLDDNCEWCMLSFIPTKEVIEPEILAYKGSLKSKTPPTPLILFDRDLCPSNPQNFSNANLINADFVNAELVDANFSNANLTGANLSGAILSGANLKGANLVNANLSGAILWDVDLHGANLRNTTIDQDTILDYDWRRIWTIVNQGGEDAKLNDAKLVKADLHGANLSNANLNNASIWDANLSRANLIKTNLHGATLSNSNLIDANLNGANLENAQLRSANFKGANLEGVNLKNADLYNTNLEGANLINADLRSAELLNASLNNADLDGANLENADLRGANLNHTNFRDANLSNANFIATSIENTRFGNNLGISESLKRDLISRGAIFEDSSDDLKV